MTDGIWKRNPDVLEAELQNGEAALLHVGTKSYYSLNKTGFRVWRLLTQGLTPSEVVSRLEAAFEVGNEVALRSVNDLLEELRAEQLLSATGVMDSTHGRNTSR